MLDVSGRDDKTVTFRDRSNACIYAMLVAFTDDQGLLFGSLGVQSKNSISEAIFEFIDRLESTICGGRIFFLSLSAPFRLSHVVKTQIAN